MANKLIRAILDSNMSDKDKHDLIAELIRLDYFRRPAEVEKLLRDYVETHPK